MDQLEATQVNSKIKLARLAFLPLYHMMAGMNRVFELGNYQNPLIEDKAKAYKHIQRESNMLHFMVQNDFATNGNDGEAMLMNTRWSLSTERRLGYNNKHGYEAETHLGRYIGKMQWLMPFVGFDWRYREMGTDENEKNLFGQPKKKTIELQLVLVYCIHFRC